MALAQVATYALAGAVLVLTLTWILYYDEGFSLSKDHSDGIFNWHPLLMSLAYAVCMPVAALQFRKPLQKSSGHAVRKAVHASFHSLAFVALLLGLAAVVASKLLNVPARGHMYTLHAYIGAVTIALSVVQFALGFGFYGLSAGARRALSAYHRPLGFFVTVVGISSVLTGYNEIQVFHMRGPAASHYTGSVVIVSVTGLAVLGMLAPLAAAMYGTAPSQEGAAQFATCGKADVNASTTSILV